MLSLPLLATLAGLMLPARGAVAATPALRLQPIVALGEAAGDVVIADDGLTKSIAMDYIGDGIRCDCLCPGTVDSPSWRRRVADSPDPEAALRDMIARQPMGRVGTPEEIAALAAYLVSDEAAYTTGTAVFIDGGLSL